MFFFEMNRNIGGNTPIYIARQCDIDIANLSVRLSVCNVPVSDENGLAYRHIFNHTVAQSF